MVFRCEPELEPPVPTPSMVRVREEARAALVERWARVSHGLVMMLDRLGTIVGHSRADDRRQFVADRLRFLNPLTFKVLEPPADRVVGTRCGYTW